MEKVIVLLAEGFEEIEALGTYDILIRGGIHVELVSIYDYINVTGSHGISVKCTESIKNIEYSEYDAVILPGGMPGAKNLKENKLVIKLLKEFNENKKLIGAICAAPTVLKEAGIINDIKLTSYPSFSDEFNKEMYMEDEVVSCKNIITSRGPATFFSFALCILERLTNKENAEKIKASMLIH